MRVLIVSRVRLYREGLGEILSRDGRLGEVATAANCRRAMEELGRRSVDLVLLDVSTKGAREAARELAAARPPTRILALGIAGRPGEVVACAELGLDGYVAREASLDELIATAQRTVAGELECSRRVAAALFERVGELAGAAPSELEAVALTPRQLEVIRLLEDGMTNKEIASRLILSEATVKNHVHSILAKLDARTRGEAAAKARRLARRRSASLPRPSP